MPLPAEDKESQVTSSETEHKQRFHCPVPEFGALRMQRAKNPAVPPATTGLRACEGDQWHYMGNTIFSGKFH